MMEKVILLDIDGVLVTEGNWKRPVFHDDGFFIFNLKAASNLEKLIKATKAVVILITSHRRNNNITKWKHIFRNRFIEANSVFIYDDFVSLKSSSRYQEIVRWDKKFGRIKNYVIIDDDSSLEQLPYNIKKRWVRTKPLIGLDDEAMQKAISILNESKLDWDYPNHHLQL